MLIRKSKRTLSENNSIRRNANRRLRRFESSHDFVNEITSAVIKINDAKSVRIERKDKDFNVFLKEVHDSLNGDKGDLSDYVIDLHDQLNDFEIRSAYLGDGESDVWMEPSGEHLIENIFDDGYFAIWVEFNNAQDQTLIQFRDEDYDLEQTMDFNLGGDVEFTGYVEISISMMLYDHIDRSDLTEERIEKAFEAFLHGNAPTMKFWVDESYNNEPDEYDDYRPY